MKKKKKWIVFGILIFFITIGVSATTILYSANNVTYSNSNLSGNNVQTALDNLYNKFETNKTVCPSGMTCTPKTTIKCIRSTSLFTEECSSGSCTSFGYTANGTQGTTTITYGNTTTIKGRLRPGDAFDCDVDGSGYNQKFFYVSDYFDTDTNNFNENIAVLSYYSNTIGGVANNNISAYDSSNQNYNGPVTAITQLPTTSQWPNISLYKVNRQILTETSTKTTTGGTLPTSFSYSGYAARLLTFQEAFQGCNTFAETYIYTPDIGIGDKCLFLLTGTYFSSYSNNIYASYLETPIANSSTDVGIANPSQAILSSIDARGPNFGVRPVIEIPKSQILY